MAEFLIDGSRGSFRWSSDVSLGLFIVPCGISCRDVFPTVRLESRLSKASLMDGSSSARNEIGETSMKLPFLEIFISLYSIYCV